MVFSLHGIQLPRHTFAIVLCKSIEGFADAAQVIDALDAVGLGLGSGECGQKHAG